jgi:hypothetical protein
VVKHSTYLAKPILKENIACTKNPFEVKRLKVKGKLNINKE